MALIHAYLSPSRELQASPEVAHFYTSIVARDILREKEKSFELKSPLPGTNIKHIFIIREFREGVAGRIYRVCTRGHQGVLKFCPERVMKDRAPTLKLRRVAETILTRCVENNIYLTKKHRLDKYYIQRSHTQY